MLFLQIPLAIKQKAVIFTLYTIKPVGAKSPTGLYLKIQPYFQLRYALYLESP